MTQEFTTTKGKAVLERNVLYLKNLDWRFHHSILYELIVPLFWIMITIMKFYEAREPFEYFVAFVLVTLAIFHGYPIYDLLFRRSLSARIPMVKIVDFTTENSLSGLETFVILKLKSGRYRKIAFRTKEPDHEAFTDMLAQSIHKPQLT